LEAIKVLLIESDAKVRLAMVSMLKGSAEVCVVGVASDALQARMQVKLRKPDVLIIATDRDRERVGKFLSELMDTAALPVLMLSDKILPASAGERQAMRAGGAILTRQAAAVSPNDQAFCDKIIQHTRRV